MKIEFPALQSEPLIYFLVHGGVFVLVLAVLFFLLGFWFGASIWGRYKHLSKLLREENDGLRGEIATLKRRLAEQGLRPSAGPAATPQLLTEVLPSVGEIFPERAAFQYPALAALPPPEEKSTTPVAPEPATEPASNEPTPVGKPPSRKPTIKAKVKKETPEPIAEPVVTEPVIAEAAVAVSEEVAEVEPFGFLLAGPVEAPASKPSASALSSIIKGSTTAPLFPAAPTLAETKTEPPVEPVAPLLTLLPEVPVIEAEIDPALGLIYKQPPPDADDLTKIKGIATVLEKRLHDLGIHTYRQIASWDDRHIREFSSRLAFKDRIAREKWVEQARTLSEARQSA